MVKTVNFILCIVYYNRKKVKKNKNKKTKKGGMKLWGQSSVSSIITNPEEPRCLLEEK